jgi:hypothetical protein
VRILYVESNKQAELVGKETRELESAFVAGLWVNEEGQVVTQ